MNIVGEERSERRGQRDKREKARTADKDEEKTR